METKKSKKAKRLLHLLWIIPLLIVLTLGTILYLVPALETVDRTPVEGSADWMKHLPDDMPLSKVVLPGTHDSATKNVQLAYITRCQALSIGEQLEAGFRYLDIRLGASGEQFRMMHGFTSCTTSGWPWAATLYLDETGDREDYWQVTLASGGMMQISAENGLVISATELRLKQLDGSNPPEQVMPSGDKWDDPKYADATEKAYVDYVTEKLVPWFNELARGQERGQVKEVSLNALFDSYYATVDIELNDGTLYELGFASGVLQYIEYYFSSRSMWWDVHYGTWMADALYRNKVTGETFYTNPPMWE